MNLANVSKNLNETKPPEAWAEAIREELFQALENKNLELFEVPGAEVSPEAEAAAFELAVALGQCRVCGVEVPADLDGTLPVPVAQAACRVLARTCEELIEDIRRLPDELGEASPMEADLLLGDCFERLMQRYTAMNAIFECYERILEEDDPAETEFEKDLDRAVNAIRKLDDVLWEPDHLYVLSEVVNLPVYWNWKNVLGEPYRSAPPWWLDGTLEAVARKVSEAFRQPIPTAVPARDTEKAAVRPSGLVRGYSAAVLYDLRVPVVLAAATAEDRPPIRQLLLWESPDGKYLARLSVPEVEPQDGRLVLELLKPNYEPAKELAGVSVWLSGIPAQVDDCGLARFSLADLRGLPGGRDAELTLEVMDRGQVWSPKG